MKKHLKIAAFIGVVLIGCAKDKSFVPVSTPITSSLQDFYDRHKPKTEHHLLSANDGGSFITAQGTVVRIPPNAFVDDNGNPVTGAVLIEFLDVYKKSDMLWTGVTTQLATGEPLKSGGEFFIRATANNVAVQLNGNAPIVVEQPLNNEPLDTAMQAFMINDTMSLAGWWNSPNATVLGNASNYVFSLYDFNQPVSAGSWCNSDNPYYFSAFTQTTLTMHLNGSIADYNPDVFLVFEDINSMVHVYRNGADFPYLYAPVGMNCTVVALGAKDGKLYASFTPVTIGNNQTVNFDLNEMSEADFETALDALN